MVGFGETYFAAFALFLGANNFQLGVLACLPPFLAGISQFSSVKLMELCPSRRRLVCVAVFIQALSFIPLYLSSHFKTLRIEIYVLVVSFYFISAALVGPAWNSWMGDLISYQNRGTYFGRRNRTMIIGTFAAMITAGFLLRHFKDIGDELNGFFIVFALAFSSRLVSWYFLNLKYDPPMPPINKRAHGFFTFMSDLRQKNQGILVLYMAAVNFGIYISAAYFTPWMLKELKYNYATYTFVVAGIAVTKFLTYSIWGECCDKFGPRKIILISGFLICFTTVVWMYTGNANYLFLSQCFTGIVWAGYEVSTFIFLLDATEPEERAQVSSYLNILVSIFGLFGGLLSAALFSLKNLMANPYYLVFGLTAVVRLVALFVFGLKLKEILTVSQVKAKDLLLKVTGFRAALGMTSRLVVLAKGRGPR